MQNTNQTMASHQSHSEGPDPSHSQDFAKIEQSIGVEGEEVTSKPVKSSLPSLDTASDATVHHGAVPGRVADEGKMIWNSDNMCHSNQEVKKLWLLFSIKLVRCTQCEEFNHKAMHIWMDVVIGKKLYQIVAILHVNILGVRSIAPICQKCWKSWAWFTALNALCAHPTYCIERQTISDVFLMMELLSSRNLSLQKLIKGCVFLDIMTREVFSRRPL